MVGGEEEMRGNKVYLHGGRFFSGGAKVYSEVDIIYISLTSHKHILIGTSKPDEAAAFLISRDYNVR
jgi:hypothetical protein